jgi:hypothetical protein
MIITKTFETATALTNFLNRNRITKEHIVEITVVVDHKLSTGATLKNYTVFYEV